jgi:hypothetical protein
MGTRPIDQSVIASATKTAAIATGTQRADAGPRAMDVEGGEMRRLYNLPR